MKPTIIRSVSSRLLKLADLLPWANKEAVLLLRDLHDAANVEFKRDFTLTSAGAGEWEVIFTSDDMPTDSVWLLEAKINGRAADTRITSVIRASFYCAGTTVAQDGRTYIEYCVAPKHIDGEAPVDFIQALVARFVIVGRTITLEVKDAGEQTEWLAVVRLVPSREAA